jgi:hypothetical protein
MKKLTFLLLFLPTLLVAQVHVDNNWKTIINPIFNNLDKSKIQSGMLLDYAMEFTDVKAYNGILTDTTYVDSNILGSMYKTLFMSKVAADTIHTPLYEKYAYNWARERYNATKDSSGVYILSGLLYDFQALNESALAQNKIRVSRGKYYDKYINGIWQNPYDTKTAFALTPPTLHSRSKDVYFKLPSELFLSNMDSQIVTIQVDTDNGQGYQNLPFDTGIHLQFYENKIHDLTFKIILTTPSGNKTLYCRSKFKIDDPTLDVNIKQRAAIVINDERVYIHEDGNFFNAAWLTIRRMPGNVANNQLTRPLIIAEGLDTGNFTAPEDFGGETTLQNFDVDIFESNSNLDGLLRGNTQQYDIIYIDWVRGMADLRDNSRVLEEVIEWVNDQKEIGVSGIMEQNVLLGQSMGGVIGRYTLARMENENTTHDVRLFVAHDSPMQGANTPLAFQHFSAHMKEEYVESPLLWAAGEVLIPIGYGLAQIGSDLLNFFGASTSVPSFVTPSQLLSLQDQTAARQLNYWSAFSTVNGNHAQIRSDNLTWQQTLDAEGWPILSRNIAISNGNECSVDNGFAPGDPLLIVDSLSNPGFLLDMLNAVLAPVVGVATSDLGLILVGAIPGNSRWQTNFDFNSYGVQGSQNLIYRGRLRFKKKILWVGPTVTYDVFNRSYNAPVEALPFDTYSGGRFNFIEADGDFALDDIPVLSDLANVVNDFYGFVPTVSALDIRKANGNDPTPNDYLKSYSGGMPSDPNLQSGFNAFIVDNEPNNPFNNEHISFQVRNGNWLAAELEVDQPGGALLVLDDCSFVCDSEDAISGPIRLCSSGNYSIDSNEVTSVVWSLEPAHAGTTTANIINPTEVVVNNNSYNGFVTLIGTVQSIRCGNNIPVEKTIYFGRPTANGSISKTGDSSLHPGPTDSAVFSVGTSNINALSSINWIVYSYSNQNASSFFNIQSLGSGSSAILRANQNTPPGNYVMQARLTNTCGFMPVNFSFSVTGTLGSGGGPGGGGSGPPVFTPRMAGNAYKVYPNPSKDIIKIDVIHEVKAQNKAEVKVSGEVFDILGKSKFKVEMQSNGAKFSVARLNPGVYVLKIYLDDTIETHQIVVK